jgi:hypothetical protein
MDFEQQKPITDDYRRGWERIYQQQEERKQYLNGCPILGDENQPKWHVENSPFGLLWQDDSMPPNEIRMSDGRQIVTITNIGLPQEDECHSPAKHSRDISTPTDPS